MTAQVQKEHYPDQPIVTEIVPAQTFHDAEKYHQFYLERNPDGYAVSTRCHTGREQGFTKKVFLFLFDPLLIVSHPLLTLVVYCPTLYFSASFSYSLLYIVLPINSCLNKMHAFKLRIFCP